MTSRPNWIERLNQVKELGRIPIIAEVKLSSPSEGELIKRHQVAQLVEEYKNGGAACISVVTGKWFGGDISLLEMVSKQTKLPLLRKDFIVNADQIKKSVDLGANAVLLTKKLLDSTKLESLIQTCLDLNITPFIEAANAKEILAIPDNKASILALANRDISQKETDIESGLKSLNHIEMSKGKCAALASASGILNSQDANTLFECGFDAMLVGTSLIRSEAPSEAVRKMSIRAYETTV